MKYCVELYEMNFPQEQDHYKSNKFYVLIGLDYSDKFNFFRKEDTFKSEPKDYIRTYRIAQIKFGDTNICPENPLQPLDEIVNHYTKKYGGSIEFLHNEQQTFTSILLYGCREFAIQSIFQEFAGK